MHEPLHAELAGQVAQDVGAVAVRADEHVGVEQGAVDVGLGREVHDCVVSRQRRGHCVPITDVAVDEGQTLIGLQVGEVGEVAGVGQLVEDRHRVIGRPQHMVDVVRADEARPSGDEQLHGRSLTWGCHCGSNAFRRGLVWSRSDSTGSVIAQSAAMSGSSQATPSSSAGL